MRTKLNIYVRIKNCIKISFVVGGLTDAELWESFQKGDSGAFELLYRKFYAVLFRYGRTFTHDDKLVEEGGPASV